MQTITEETAFDRLAGVIAQKNPNELENWKHSRMKNIAFDEAIHSNHFHSEISTNI